MTIAVLGLLRTNKNPNTKTQKNYQQIESMGEVSSNNNKMKTHKIKNNNRRSRSTTTNQQQQISNNKSKTTTTKHISDIKSETNQEQQIKNNKSTTNQKQHQINDHKTNQQQQVNDNKNALTFITFVKRRVSKTQTCCCNSFFKITTTRSKTRTTYVKQDEFETGKV